MMSLIISDLQARLYRLQLRVGNRWDGGAPKHSPPVSLSTRSPIQNHIALLIMPLATHRLQLPVCNRGTEGLPDFHLL